MSNRYSILSPTDVGAAAALLLALYDAFRTIAVVTFASTVGTLVAPDGTPISINALFFTLPASTSFCVTGIEVHP